MERKITNIDEFQMDENETPILPTGLREEENLYVLPDGRYLPCALETLKRTRASVLNQGARPLPAYYLRLIGQNVCPDRTSVSIH